MSSRTGRTGDGEKIQLREIDAGRLAKACETFHCDTNRPHSVHPRKGPEKELKETVVGLFVSDWRKNGERARSDRTHPKREIGSSLQPGDSPDGPPTHSAGPRG